VTRGVEFANTGVLKVVRQLFVINSFFV